MTLNNPINKNHSNYAMYNLLTVYLPGPILLNKLVFKSLENLFTF